MEFEDKINEKLRLRGFTQDKLLNNRGLIGAAIDEVALMIVKNSVIHDVSKCEELKKELYVTDKLLSERQRVLDAIPERKIHGKCVPHAIEWINSRKQYFQNMAKQTEIMKYYFFRDTDNESNLLDRKTYHAAGYVEKLYCELDKPNGSGKDLAVSFFNPFDGFVTSAWRSVDELPRFRQRPPVDHAGA